MSAHQILVDGLEVGAVESFSFDPAVPGEDETIAVTRGSMGISHVMKLREVPATSDLLRALQPGKTIATLQSRGRPVGVVEDVSIKYSREKGLRISGTFRTLPSRVVRVRWTGDGRDRLRVTCFAESGLRQQGFLARSSRTWIERPRAEGVVYPEGYKSRRAIQACRGQGDWMAHVGMLGEFHYFARRAQAKRWLEGAISDRIRKGELCQ